MDKNEVTEPLAKSGPGTAAEVTPTSGAVDLKFDVDAAHPPLDVRPSVETVPGQGTTDAGQSQAANTNVDNRP